MRGRIGCPPTRRNIKALVLRLARENTGKGYRRIRAETRQHRDQADTAGHNMGDLDELAADLDEEITRSGRQRHRKRGTR